LDRETSGPVIVAKNEKVWKKLQITRNNHDWHKEYLCLVHGRIPVKKAEGVLQNYLIKSQSGSGDRSAKMQVVDKYEKYYDQMPKTVLSIYQVEGYYEMSRDGGSQFFTLVKVRILTGARHQIRVQMSQLMKELGKEAKAPDCGIISDFLYLRNASSQTDKWSLCDRVWLHCQALGMWNPDDSSCLVYATAPLPQDLQDCLKKMRMDDSTNKELEKHRAEQASQNNVEKFCHKYKIGPYEKKELYKWHEWHKKNFCPRWGKTMIDELIEGFEQRLQPGSNTLSVSGDHSFLMRGILQTLNERTKDLHQYKNAEILGTILDDHIVNRLWQQQQRNEQAEEVQSQDPLPPGWRRFEGALSGVHFLHESGFKDKRKPIIDDLPNGWVKFECNSRPGKFLFYHLTRRTTQFERPQQEVEVPDGWMKMIGGRNGTPYYLHMATGISQLGRPCPGPPEDLPPDWEKVYSVEKKRAYYWNRLLKKHSIEKPQLLPPGWTEHMSKSGRKYFWHEATKTSQFDRPTQELRARVEAVPEPLPPGWEECTSSSGKKYFWHQATKASQYTRPTQDMQTPTVEAVEPLPPGWEERTSTSSGRKYFWHKASDKTQYDRPVELEEHALESPPRD